jgi:hypothetical protein
MGTTNDPDSVLCGTLSPCGLIKGLLERLVRRGKAVTSEVDREAAINVLVARTDMSPAEAAETVDNWTETYPAGYDTSGAADAPGGGRNRGSSREEFHLGVPCAPTRHGCSRVRWGDRRTATSSGHPLKWVTVI